MAVVDIAIPCYRYGRFLPECVASIREQSLTDWRILIVDDASPDGSGDVARALAATDTRIEALVHDENLGPIRTYNDGVDWAKSPYFMVLSADDRLASGALARAVSLMNACPGVAMTYGEYALIDEAGAARGHSLVAETHGVVAGAKWRVSLGEMFIHEICRSGRNPVATPTVIARTSVQKLVGGYEPSLPHACDMEMWMRLAVHGAVARTNALQGHYRLHGANMSSGYVSRVLADYEQRHAAFESLFTKHGHQLRKGRALRDLARRTLAESAFWTGVAQCCRGELVTGKLVLRFAFELRPRMRLLPPLGRLLRRQRPFAKAREILAYRRSRRSPPLTAVL